MIRNLLFDLGTVTLHMDFVRPATLMRSRCHAADIGDARRFMQAFYGDPMLVEYECGRIDTPRFVEHFIERLGFDGGAQEFIDIWRSVFSLNEPMVALIRELAAYRPVYYFSNTGPMHVPYVYQRFPEIAVHRGDALSHELGVMKPDPEFYLRGMRRLGLEARECFFVDDVLANVEAARRLGIEAVHYTHAAETVARIRERLAGNRAAAGRGDADISGRP